MSSRFLGREAARADLVQRLAPGRLVTVIGTSGCGKSRFIAESLRSWDPLWCAVDRDPLPTAGEPVVVLDGCDGLARTLQPTIEALVGSGTTVIASCRDLLGVHEEWVLPLGPLDEAVELLQVRLEEASAPPIDPEAALDLASGLGGLPLAIELVAGGIAVRGLDSVQQSLGAQLASQREAGERMVRERVIRVVADWALDGLAPDELDLLSDGADPADPRCEHLTRLGLLQRAPWQTDRPEIPPAVRDRLHARDPDATTWF